jgi:predicted nuclease of predicted toxin-antitoxin system
LEEFRGINDEKIIEISSGRRLIIITFDKDFGYLVFRRMVGVPFGVILLRIPLKSPDCIFKMLKWIILESRMKFEQNFVVVTESKVRIVVTTQVLKPLFRGLHYARTTRDVGDTVTKPGI